MLDSAGSLHFWEQKPPGLQLDPIEISGVMGAVTDVLATWNSSLNVCETAAGVYFWGLWLGKHWSRPKMVNFSCGHLAFAADSNIMCQPVLMVNRETSLAHGLSQIFDVQVSAYYEFKHTQKEAMMLTTMIHLQEMADTKLIVNEQDTIYVHKAILTCMSDFFKTMFKGNYWEETGVPSRYDFFR